VTQAKLPRSAMTNARKKAISKMAWWSIGAEVFWRTASVNLNGATGCAEVGCGMRRTVRSRDADVVVRRDVKDIGLQVRGKLSEWKVERHWGGGRRSRRAGLDSRKRLRGRPAL